IALNIVAPGVLTGIGTDANTILFSNCSAPNLHAVCPRSPRLTKSVLVGAVKSDVGADGKCVSASQSSPSFFRRLAQCGGLDGELLSFGLKLVGTPTIAPVSRQGLAV